MSKRGWVNGNIREEHYIDNDARTLVNVYVKIQFAKNYNINVSIIYVYLYKYNNVCHYALVASKLKSVTDIG